MEKKGAKSTICLPPGTQQALSGGQALGCRQVAEGVVAERRAEKGDECGKAKGFPHPYALI